MAKLGLDGVTGIRALSDRIENLNGLYESVVAGLYRDVEDRRVEAEAIKSRLDELGAEEDRVKRLVEEARAAVERAEAVARACQRSLASLHVARDGAITDVRQEVVRGAAELSSAGERAALAALDASDAADRSKGSALEAEASADSAERVVDLGLQGVGSRLRAVAVLAVLATAGAVVSLAVQLFN